MVLVLVGPLHVVPSSVSAAAGLSSSRSLPSFSASSSVLVRMPHCAYFLVHSRAVRSCSSRSYMYCCAIEPTSGSFGFASVSIEQIDSSTFDAVRAGLLKKRRRRRRAIGQASELNTRGEHMRTCTVGGESSG